MPITSSGEKKKYTCMKCGKTMSEVQFFTYKDGSKTEMCKECLTMHIDNFDPETYVWLIQKMDVPYVPFEWETIRDRIYEKDPKKLTSSAVFGRYLSKMKLKQYKDYGWADSEMLQQEKQAKADAAREEMDKMAAELKERFDNGEISEAEYKTLTNSEEQHKHVISPTAAAGRDLMTGIIPPGSVAANMYNPEYMQEDELPDPAADLTEEDKIYLAMKWGRLYKPSEWIELEKMYEQMMESFDIQDADTKATLVFICKTNLKMNQAIDTGDVDAFQKLSRVNESLRKSAKFTAAQNKEDKNDFVDSVGELISMCEREGFIPRYATDIPQDKVDITLKDMNDYLYKLVTQDLGFGQQIEDALKKIQIQKEMNENATAAENGDALEVDNEDYAAFLEEAERQKEMDADLAIDDFDNPDLQDEEE